jgi:hypothetical protein
MSVDSAWDVQSGVFTCLSGSTALTSLLASGANGVLDHVPAGTVFPYVVLGETSARPMDSQRISGNEITVTIHAYSRGSGMHQLKNIMSAVYDALHDVSFSVPNQVLVLCQCLDTATLLEGDGLTRHGIQRFKIITEPA